MSRNYDDLDIKRTYHHESSTTPEHGEFAGKMSGTPDFVPEDLHGEINRRNGNPIESNVTLVSHADFPTRFGHFVLYGFYDRVDGKEHTAVVKGDVRGAERCPVRVHSQCHTGDVWGSLRCDCRDQLEASLHYISEQPFGAIVYMQQEGRGIGLLNKIKAYRLQDLGLDTIEANEYLGYPAENRDYGAAARIIELLEIRSVSLMTNNPDKIDRLAEKGVSISDRIPVVIDPNRFNAGYLETKRRKMGHLL